MREHRHTEKDSDCEAKVSISREICNKTIHRLDQLDTDYWRLCLSSSIMENQTHVSV